MSVPGTFDGQKYEDLRVLMPKEIANFYKEEMEWDKIIKYRSYEKSEVITVRRTKHTVKHKWIQQDRHWYIVDEEYVFDSNSRM